MNVFTIAVESKEGTSLYHTTADGIHDALRRIGLEWKTADWAHDQTVLIAIAPSDPNDWGLN